MTTPLTVARSAALALLLTAAGCARQPAVMLPPGLAENEARRATSAIALASEAARTRNTDAAADKYRRAVREFREFPAAWNNLGVLMMQDDQYLQAAEAFSTAADLSPSDPRPLYNLGLLWDRRGYLREARRYYERAIARDANYLPALRGVIRADSLLNEGSTQTLSWLEQDDAWLSWMRLQKARIENLPSVRMQKQYF